MAESAPVDVGETFWSCSGKRRYSTEAQANASAAHVWGKRGVELRVYACDKGCGGFHLTHTKAVTSGKPGWRPPRMSQQFSQPLERKGRDRRRPNRRGSY